MLQPYTVILSGLAGVGSISAHVDARDGRAAYRKVLRNLYRTTEPDPEQYPFDMEEAEKERPLISVIEGHVALAA